jgi:hypothetical protein
MSTVQHPPGAIGAAPPPALPTIDLSDPEAAKRWAGVLREQIDDAIGAGLDATDPPGRRLLGRYSARVIVVEAAECIESLCAGAGLSDGTPPGMRASTRVRTSTVINEHEGAAPAKGHRG